MPTIIDVAREAGVSTATVSNYLNGTKAVSESKKKRIDAAIEKLNYIPNYSAKILKGNFNNEIGVLLPNLNNPYYVQLLQGIESYFRQNDFSVSITISDELPEIELGIINNFLKKQVSGMIIITCQPNNAEYFYQNIIKNYKPLVLIDRRIDGLVTNFVCFDNEEAVYKLTAMYLEKGFKRIAIFSGPDEYTCERDAVTGYVRALKDYHIEICESLISRSVISKETAFKAVIHMLTGQQPEVIITTATNNAAGIIEGLLFSGFSVPEDVVVASLGEDTWSIEALNRNIFTTRRQSIYLGKTAASLLHRQIKSPMSFEPETIVFQDRFIGGRGPGIVSPFKGLSSQSLRVMMVKKNTQVDTLIGLLPNFIKNTGINVEVDTVPHKNYLETLLKALKGLDIPDVFMVDMPWLYALAEEKILADLSDYINSSKFDKNIFLPNCLKYLSELKGRYYGLPFFCIPQLLYYRKDLFSNKALQYEYKSRFMNKLNPPRTWTEFNAIASFFTKKYNPGSPTEYGTSIPCAFPECFSSEIHIRLRTYGSRICDERFRVIFDSPETLKGYVHLIEGLKYCPPDFTSKDRSGIVADFVNGKIAMFITFQSIIPNIEMLQRSRFAHNFGFSQVPGGKSILGGWSMCMAEKSTKRDIGFRFINWACGDEIANYLTLLTGQSAIERMFENDEFVNLYPWMLTYRDIYKTAQPFVLPHAPGKKIIHNTTIDEILYQSVYQIINNRLTIKDAIKDAHEKFKGLFQEYGYPQN